jgi:rod shape-determining protein MreC
MKHLFSGRVRIILIVAVLLSAALAILGNALGMNLPTMLTQSVLAPIKYGATALTDQAEQWYSYMFRYEAVAAENEALRERIANMEDEARRADAVERENQRLREALGLKTVHEDYDLADAYIIGRSSTDWNNTLTINRGTDAGIDVGMCAITANGQVVGLVVEAAPNYAVVKTVLDSTLEISCIIASSGYNGMCKGGYFYKDINHIKLDYLPSSAIIRNKDEVVTSGSTVYPRNLIVGYVVDAGFDDTGVAKFAVLEPAVEIASLEQIFILTNYTTE